MDKIERGRIWNHRNGQLEQDIFDRDLRIKELTAENAWLKKERIDQDKWWTQEMKDVNAENAKLKAQLAVSESIRNHSLRAENVKLENEKACHTMDLASRDTEIGMLKHSLAKLKVELDQAKWAAKVNADEHAQYEDSLKKHLSSVESERAKCREAIKQCVGWIEPVMEGFSVPKDSAGYKVLTDAKEALEGSK